MPIDTPNWVKHAIFYQIFPDRFARSQQPATQPFQTISYEDWDAPPTLQGYKGGNLWGTIEQLDYLQHLGINALYFTPIFQSTSNHRYHTHDYYQVDPLLGGNEAFEQLLQAAHNRNIKVVLDGVFNHCSRGFFFFNDILENGPFSPWLDWFKIEGWPLSAYDGSLPANYKGWVNERALPEFNHENSDTRKYIMDIAEYWIQFGIDGWRLDVPYEIKVPGFWQEFRSRVKTINPDAYIVGEVWKEAQQWLNGDQFDGVMNYQFTGPTLAFAGGDRIQPDLVQPSYQPYPALDASGYAAKIQRLLTLYPWEIQLTQFNLINSHDTARLLTMTGGEPTSVRLATLLLLTFPGAPSIYYGDEVGLPGGLDPDCRRGFPDQDQWDQETLTYHRQLIALRQSYPALRTGQYHILWAQGNVYVFARTLHKETLIIAVNVGIETINIPIEPQGICFPEGVTRPLPSRPCQILYGTGKAQWKDRQLSSLIHLSIPPRDGLILGPEKMHSK